MKVLFVIYPEAFIVPGGGEVQLLKTKEALERCGVQVDLYDMWKPNIRQYDVLHIFSLVYLPVLCEEARKHNIPIACSPIIWVDENTSEEEKNYILRSCQQPDALLCNSPSEVRQLGLLDIPKDRLHVTYNAIDKKNAHGPGPELFCTEYGLENKKYILSLANIDRRKNQLRLLQAYQELNLSLPLIIIGEAINGDVQYERQITQTTIPGVRVLNALPHGSDMLKSACQGAAVHVLPSLLETPGLASLEAAALGTKIVTTQGGSTRDYFGDMVEYVDPFSVDDIKRGIRNALDNETDTDAVRTHIINNFTWERTAQETLDVYKKLLS